MRLALRLVIARFVTAAGLAALVAHAQSPSQSGLVRGVLVENNAGEIVVRSGSNLVYHFSCDNRTWIERSQERVTASSLLPGELLEVVSDRYPQLVRYARVVHVLEKSAPKRRVLSAGNYRLAPGPGALVAPPGDLTFSGIVAALDGQRIRLRTRLDGEKIIFLSPDTQYFAGGMEVDSKAILPNIHVYLRAGVNSKGDIEAYQIIWGDIIQSAADLRH